MVDELESGLEVASQGVYHPQPADAEALPPGHAKPQWLLLGLKMEPAVGRKSLEKRVMRPALPLLEAGRAMALAVPLRVLKRLCAGLPVMVVDGLLVSLSLAMFVKGAVFPTPLIEWPAGFRVQLGRFFPHTPSSLPVRSALPASIPGRPSFPGVGCALSDGAIRIGCALPSGDAAAPLNAGGVLIGQVFDGGLGAGHGRRKQWKLSCGAGAEGLGRMLSFAAPPCWLGLLWPMCLLRILVLIVFIQKVPS